MKKKSVMGWTFSIPELKYHRTMVGGDRMSFEVFRGNPNPLNYTKTNMWKKVRITIEEV